jgi:site-specific DNA-methyltransferase (adenine-specific)/adenine-specific DNA-methyltransferase
VFRASARVGADEVATEAYDDTWAGGLGTYLSAMAERFEAMYALLAPYGSLYVHLEPAVAHYVKVVLDEIFGSSFGEPRAPGFRNQIVWCYSGGGIPRSEYPRKHDVILWYTKGDRWTFNTRYRPYSKGTVERGRTAVKGANAKLRGEGTPITDWWTDVKRITSPTDPEKLYYGTQKSEQLLERIVSVASNPGDLVADFFCGSGTTLAVAEKLGRRWIGCDAGRMAFHTTRKRLLDIPNCRPLEVLGAREGESPEAFDAAVEGGAAGRAVVRLTGYSPREEIAETLPWADLVDFWSVDWDFDGKVFRQDWAAWRTRKRRELPFATEHEYAAPGIYTVAIKVVDAFGYESLRTFRIAVS